MKEAAIRAKVREELEADGYVCWVPAKVRFRETDIFGIWDMAAWKQNEIRYIQYTSKSNMNARKWKILKFYDQHGVYHPCEVWGWDDKKKEFSIIEL